MQVTPHYITQKLFDFNTFLSEYGQSIIFGLNYSIIHCALTPINTLDITLKESFPNFLFMEMCMFISYPHTFLKP